MISAQSIQKKYKIYLFIILLLAFLLRIYGISWDDGWHLHPDERMLILVAERIDFSVAPNTNFLSPYNNKPLPAQLAELLQPLNPNFFNYGSLPIYLLKGTSDLVSLFSRMPDADYNNMLGIGRTLSAFFDVVTVLFIYKISRKLFKKESISLLASFLYAFSFFPIQNAHFYIVDPILTMFITITLYLLIRYVERPSLSKIVGISLFAAGAITTKFTGVLVLPIIVGVILIASLRKWSSWIPACAGMTAHLFLFTFSFLLFTFLFMPFGFLNYTQFIKEISLQLQMNSDPFIFPYTLQYVGTTSYWYYLKNIFLWGLGPVVSTLAIFGLLLYVKQIYHGIRTKMKDFGFKILDLRFYLFLIPASFFLIHFLIIGRSAVKFMRYMLPLYPYLAILASYGVYKILHTSYFIHHTSTRKLLASLVLVIITIWTLTFMSIYSHPHTRIEASEWIYENIPAGSTIAVEHWDDQLPLPLPNNNLPLLHSTYQFETLELYNPDTPEKWMKINEQLNRTDYIVIASNRLYVPLQKMTDCNTLPEYRCYPETADYYQRLFNEEESFHKVAEFTSFPQLGIGNWKLEIRDEGADESFTVYDHPKVMIFKKE